MKEQYKHLPLRSGVGIVVLNKKNKIFVAKRIDNPKNFWQMPQGGIDEGEDPKAAAYRELLEETGVNHQNVKFLASSSKWLSYDLPEDLIPKLWDGRYRGQKQKWFLFKFLGSDEDINIVTENPEFSNWKWIPKKYLLKEIVPFKKSVYKSVIKEFERI